MPICVRMDALKGITFPAGLDETPLADGGKVTCCFETVVGTELFQSANDGLECWADGGGGSRIVAMLARESSIGKSAGDHGGTRTRSGAITCALARGDNDRS
jgi:hypothetical protein